MEFNRTTATILFFLSFTLALSGQTGPETLGSWDPVLPTNPSDPSNGLIPVAAALLPDGKVLCWSAYDRLNFGGDFGKTYTAIFDPANGTFAETLVENLSHDMFCPGINNLPDGRILVAGGSSSQKTSIYNPFTEEWEVGGAMNIARGYQANVTLPDGKAFTIGGSWSGLQPPFGFVDKFAEVFDPATNQWSLLPGIPVTPLMNLNYVDSFEDPSQLVDHQDVALDFPYREDNHAWLWVAPNGKVFHAGPGEMMNWLDPKANNNEGTYTQTKLRGTPGNPEGYSMCGITVMFDIGKILKAGGSTAYEDSDPNAAPVYPANNECYVIDINTDDPVVTDIPDMTYQRTYLNAVVIPTGEVIIFGGADNAHTFSDDGAANNNTPEMYDPVSNSWSFLEPMQNARTYHSVALLLPDGRILTGGGGLCGSGCAANHPDVQIYYPPYFYDDSGNLASRPTIDACPLTAKYNESMVVKTSCNIESFVFMRYASSTHSTNNEQRRIPVTFQNVGVNTYELSVPSANLLPPGYYMLFAIDDAGVPSISQRVLVGNSPALAQAPDDFCQIPNNGNWDMDAYSSDQNASGVDERVDYAIDGDLSTTWSSSWTSGQPSPPHYIEVDMNGTYDVVGFTYVPRQGLEYRGIVKEYKFEVSSDGSNWTEVANGTFAPDRSHKFVPFSTVSNQRYFRFTGESNISDLTIDCNYNNHPLMDWDQSCYPFDDPYPDVIAAGEIMVYTNACSPSKTSQTITFNSLANKSIYDNDFTISATASSGLGVNFSLICGPAILEGNEITLTGLPGTVTIRADQDGDGTFENAPSVEQSFEVEHPTQNCNAEDFTGATINDYAGGASGLAEISYDGTGLWLINDNSISIDINYTLTSSTVLAFEFSADQAGEYHGIGLDNNNNANNGNRSFMLYGNSSGESKYSADNEDYNTYNGSGFQSFVIPIGTIYSSFSPDRIFFISDHGSAQTIGTSYFRNVRIYESGACSNFNETTVKIKMNLQGPWDTGNLDMANSLVLNGYAKNLQQYSGAPWNYSGEECVAEFPDDCIDWVLVNLRDPNDEAAILYQRTCILKEDGTVIDTNGSDVISFGRTGLSSGYISVHHRNHLGIMTADPVDFDE